MKVLIIGQVWPEPTSSAAGNRMMQLIELFQSENWEVHFASASVKGEAAADFGILGIVEHTIALNNSSFDAFAKALQPDIVMFDRFMVEEQFGWRIAENCPDALRILDTEDLHGLRKGREAALKQNVSFTEEFLVNDYAKREIASIYRCDLSLIISEVELDYLKSFFHVPEALLLYLPFMVEKLTETSKNRWKTYENRQDFMTIGNFRHEPNWQSARYLKEAIWPMIKKELPDAQLKIYGSYPSQKVMQLHNPQEGFYIMGKAENAFEVIGDSRVLLAPLRTGAGLKGKLLEAMQCGTPAVTTSIGAEGMNGNLPFNGEIIDDPDLFAERAVNLYRDIEKWQKAQKNGIEIINTRFLKQHWFPIAKERFAHVLANLPKHRLHNFTGAMLQHHSLQSTKFMSRWIEEKNK